MWSIFEPLMSNINVKNSQIIVLEFLAIVNKAKHSVTFYNKLYEHL